MGNIIWINLLLCIVLSSEVSTILAISHIAVTAHYPSYSSDEFTLSHSNDTSGQNQIFQFENNNSENFSEILDNFDLSLLDINMATDSNARENLHPVVDSTSGQSSVVEENCRSSEYFSDNFNILDHSDLNSILDPDNGIEWRNADEELPEISDNELHNKFLLDPKSFDSIKLRTVEHINNKESKTGTELVTEGNSQPAVVQDFFIR
ncbi:unnamed protein product, partial [Brugia timori]|uniref:Uncharacterized protein n=1 Tax=Brugia timori TaxID=42155 RepID=A0A0R3QGC0_9BILA